MSQIIDQPIQWGVNADIGFTGLISRKKDWISKGISWFEKWDRLNGDPPVSHAFIITGPDETIEAFATGVHYGRITDYLRDPDVALIVKRPHCWTREVGQQIITEAQKHVGDKYNYTMIGALALSNTYLGHWINRLTCGWSERFLTELAERKNTEICSELVAKSMRAHYGWLGMLQQTDNEVTPQIILSDWLCYDPPAVELLPP